MFKLLYPLPKKYFVACSGGVDSMAALHFLNKRSRKECIIGVAYYNHGTGKFAKECENLVSDYCNKYDLNFRGGLLTKECPPRRSMEDWWRENRYVFFDNLTPIDVPIILAHNLDDCVEEYVMNTMVRGYSDTIAYQRGRCIRPFRLWKKDVIYAYAKRAGLDWLEDPSNTNLRYKRSLIRHKVLPAIKELNPGIHKIVQRMIRSENGDAPSVYRKKRKAIY